MADRLTLPQVAFVATGGTFYQNDRLMIPVKFKCPFGTKIAKDLSCEDAVYSKVNGKSTRRPVAEIKLLTKYEGADLQFSRAPGFDPTQVRAEKISNFLVVNENERTDLHFQVHCAYDDIGLITILKEQKKEPCESLLIIGDQRELEFSAPKKGRPKKQKDKE